LRLILFSVRLELLPMQSLILGLNLRILPFQNPYLLVPLLYRITKTIDNLQMLLIHIMRPPILAQDPRRGQSIQIRTGMLIEADEIIWRPGLSGHA